MLQLRLPLIVMPLAVAAMACTQVAPEDLAFPPSSTVKASVEATPSTTSTLMPSLVVPPVVVTLDDLSGSIALAGAPELGTSLPTGEQVWAAPAETRFSQPTWLRDGTPVDFLRLRPTR